MTQKVTILGVLLVLLVGLMAIVPAPGAEVAFRGTLDTRESSCESRLARMNFSVERYDGAVAAPRFDVRATSGSQYDEETNTNAWLYRTKIREAVAKGVNYAGEYVLAEWGIGTGMKGHAIVNARTGEIVDYGLKSREGVEFSLGSSLLVVNPKKNFVQAPDREAAREYAATMMREFYSIDGGTLSLICSETADKGW